MKGEGEAEERLVVAAYSTTRGYTPFTGLSRGLDPGVQGVMGYWTCLPLWDVSPLWEVEEPGPSCQAGGDNTPA